MAAAAHKQKEQYDRHTRTRSFRIGDAVWLSVPTAGKLDPRWEGEWIVDSIKSPITVEIANGRTSKVVHVNRLQHRFTPSTTASQIKPPQTNTAPPQWTPPTVDHIFLPDDIPINSR